MPTANRKQHPLYLAVAASLAASVSYAQEQAANTDITAPAIEEVLVLGRLKSAADSIIDERIEQPFAADLLGSEQISRTGDSNVAAALLRVTGVTIVEDQYVYVRSLGERYSSTQLNGAAVPSPELTRNVLPLDLIPASIVQTLKIQKAWSPDLPANFGGGNVDIKTKSVPEDLVFTVGVGTGANSERSEGGLYTANASTNGLPNEIRGALNTYAGGTLDIERIRQQGNVSFEEARQINRDLALSLDRNIEIQEKSHPLDYSIDFDLGNSWDLTDDITVGAIASFSRNDESRNRDYKEQGIGAPDTVYSSTRRSIDEIKELASLNGGISYQDNHNIAFNSYLIRNTEEEAIITTGHDGNRQAISGEQYIEYGTRYEERDLRVLQALGEHTFDQLSGNILGDIKIDWFSSESKATTDVPQKSDVEGLNIIKADTGEVLSTGLLPGSSMASFTFLELEDRVRSRGANIHLPLAFSKTEITLSGGYSYNDKSREYYGYTANVGSSGSNNVLVGTPGVVLANSNLANSANDFEFSMGTGLGKESYIAGQITDAAYGMLDFTYDYTWRFTAGARYENFRQALLPIDLLDFDYVQDAVDDLQDLDQKFALSDDDWYPSLALTYMNEGFMGSETFQLRGSVSKTAVRPDLREKSEVQFFNEDNIRVKGNPALLNSELNHYDLRAEWFYSSGDNFTTSLFYKDLSDPIEQSRAPGSDDDIILEFYNAESGEIYGLELEGLKDLGAGFFLSGNVTLSKSEIISQADRGFTNIERSMTGHSEYVVNAQLGYDSDDGRHSVSTVYNVFGERVYYAAIGNGHDDAFEQPFHSLDVVYSFYPTDTWTTKLKLTNLLGENRVYEQVNSLGERVTILDREVGTGLSLELSYSY